MGCSCDSALACFHTHNIALSRASLAPMPLQLTGILQACPPAPVFHLFLPSTQILWCVGCFLAGVLGLLAFLCNSPKKLNEKVNKSVMLLFWVAIDFGETLQWSVCEVCLRLEIHENFAYIMDNESFGGQFCTIITHVKGRNWFFFLYLLLKHHCKVINHIDFSPSKGISEYFVVGDHQERVCCRQKKQHNTWQSIGHFVIILCYYATVEFVGSALHICWLNSAPYRSLMRSISFPKGSCRSSA